ncbi:MAG TPA: GNAT family N-acetyltransferase [Polyangiaceae bacterium]|nr:GNAT family N-acetyltransferase [Polyangiaceae bacterium]
MTHDLRVHLADLDDPADQGAILALTQAYAHDPMGNDGPLPDAVIGRLIDGLRAHPTTLVFLARDGGEPVGIATCFVGFSTFAAKPLVNIHDLAVVPSHRRGGVGRALLRAVEDEARARGCCKLTLEVLSNNEPALRAYETFGFSQARYAEAAGAALFYAKAL